jgi:hypothetical protein
MGSDKHRSDEQEEAVDRNTPGESLALGIGAEFG